MMMVHVGLEPHLNTPDRYPHDHGLVFSGLLLGRSAIESNHTQQLTFVEQGRIFLCHPQVGEGCA